MWLYHIFFKDFFYFFIKKYWNYIKIIYTVATSLEGFEVWTSPMEVKLGKKKVECPSHTHIGVKEVPRLAKNREFALY